MSVCLCVRGGGRGGLCEGCEGRKNVGVLWEQVQGGEGESGESGIDSLVCVNTLCRNTRCG